MCARQQRRLVCNALSLGRTFVPPGLKDGTAEKCLPPKGLLSPCQVREERGLTVNRSWAKKWKHAQELPFQPWRPSASPGKLLGHTDGWPPLHPPPTQASGLTRLGETLTSIYFLEVSTPGDSNVQPRRGIST